jgi:hypothetical protein
MRQLNEGVNIMSVMSLILSYCSDTMEIYTLLNPGDDRAMSKYARCVCPSYSTSRNRKCYFEPKACSFEKLRSA